MPATASAAASDGARSHCLVPNPVPIGPSCLLPGPHLPQATIAGTPQEGQSVSCANDVLSISILGSLLNALPKTWKFQADGAQVASGSSSSYTLAESDAGKLITCSLSIGGTINVPVFGNLNISISSTPSVPLGPVTSLPLDNVSVPTVSGTAQAGQTLTCAPGSWSVAPQNSTRTWLANGSPVGSGATLPLTASHVGKTITCREDVSRYERTNSATSGPKGPVAAAPVAVPPDNNTNTNTNTGTNNQGTTPTNNALAQRRAIARKRAAAIKKCKKRFRKASQRKKRAACVKKAKRRYRVR
jgi:hypothetical protein